MHTDLNPHSPFETLSRVNNFTWKLLKSELRLSAGAAWTEHCAAHPLGTGQIHQSGPAKDLGRLN